MKSLFLFAIIVGGLFFVCAGTASAQTSPVQGLWNAQMNTPGGAINFDLDFKVDGEKLTGIVKRSRGDVPLTGTVKGNDISFTYTVSYNDNPITLSLTGTVTGDNISGTIFFNADNSDNWSAKRAPVKKP